MRLKLQPATVEDAESIAALRNAVSDDLTFNHGKGPWTGYCTTAAVLQDLRQGKLYVAFHRGEAIATLMLSPRKPGTIDLARFSPVQKPLFLTAMAVAPERQRQGLGRALVAEMVKLAQRAKADAVLLGTFDHAAAGAGEFCRKCGFREVARASDRGVSMVYYERSIGRSVAQ